MSVKITNEGREIIKKYIEERGMKKSFFCQKCKISLQTLNKILKGSLNIFDWTLSKIAKFIGVDFDKLYIKEVKLQKEKFGAVNTQIVLEYMKTNKLYFCDFCKKCKTKMWDMRNILFDYHRFSPEENFLSIAEVIGVTAQKLFKGISVKAKRLVKEFQGEEFFTKYILTKL